MAKSIVKQVHLITRGTPTSFVHRAIKRRNKPYRVFAAQSVRDKWKQYPGKRGLARMGK